MRRAKIFRNGCLAGILIETDNGDYLFEYDEKFILDQKQPAISLTMPKSKKTYSSEFMFPFFYNLLSEGVNKKLQSKHLKIDENDFFGLLVKTAKYDTIGPVTVREIIE